ncbi:hypothetical protein L873DRAFT_1789702 [Choiromyces venosus 120613-1]|uniref:Uncharacterized protein n=1 Tax=Choiromyces venosus 120613-1 TaxID=1336337 RepID=A0A3N4JQR9_9PEZI|nr:hypothetical protein L873DRAFT_1789702 [Choiromyces venosus 120613-1]
MATSSRLASSSARASFTQPEDDAVNGRVFAMGDEFADVWGNSDYESDPAILASNSGGQHTTADYVQHDSDAEDAEDILHPPDKSTPSSQQTIPGAGRALGDVAGYAELNQAMLQEP